MAHNSSSIANYYILQAVLVKPTLFGASELSVTRWGTVRIDHGTKMTNMDGVFAAGDIVRGASLVVWAIRDGCDAADAIHEHISASLAPADAMAAE